jgi:chlorite dismutase
MAIAQTPYTVVMMMTATPSWLGLTHEKRTAFTTEHIQPLLEKYRDHVHVRFFDAEAFAARCSDFVIFTTLDLRAYYFLIEELRDTAMFTAPYFVVNDVLIGLENGYRDFEKVQQLKRCSSYKSVLVTKGG